MIGGDVLPEGDGIGFEANRHGLLERLLTYRRRMARLCAVQVVYVRDIHSKFNQKKSDSEIDISSVDAENDESVVFDLCSNVLYFYKNVFAIKQEYSSDRKNKRVDERFLKELVMSAIVNSKEIDATIISYLKPGWTLERLDHVVRAILRCAVGEMKFNVRADVPILTSEYTNLAGNFFGGKEIGFVNGIVDKIGKSLISKSEISL